MTWGARSTPKSIPCWRGCMSSGINGLWAVAREHGFQAAETYLSKCHLCQDIRRYLVMDRELTFAELAPRGFYENLSTPGAQDQA